jgi:NADH dehydrogenase
MSETLEDIHWQTREIARPRDSESLPRKRIVIVGGGFAGIAAARALKRCDADVVLIDQRNHHIFQPLLYQVATAVLSPSEIAGPIRQLAKKQKNVSVMLAEVTGIDLKSRSVEASCRGVGLRRLPFDYLVVATGTRPSYFGHDEFARYAPGLKSLGDAEVIRTKILSAFEIADATDDEDERARQMTFELDHSDRGRQSNSSDVFRKAGPKSSQTIGETRCQGGDRSQGGKGRRKRCGG